MQPQESKQTDSGNEELTSVEAGYQVSDASAKGLAIFGISFVLFIVLCLGGLVLLWEIFYHWKHHPKAFAQPTSQVKPVQLYQGPLLQIHPELDLDTYKKKEEKELTSYQWVDRQHGIVKIPITRAFEILEQQQNQPQNQNHP